MEAFTASVELLQAAEKRAAELGMTKSGFYRYCLAKEIGLTEEQAKGFGDHRAVTVLRQKVTARAVEPSSFPVTNSVGDGKMGQKREFPETVQLVAEVGAEYVAPVVQVPPQPRTVPAEPLPDHTPSQREAILGSIPVAMKIARERKATDDKRAAHAKAKAAKKEKDDADRKARAEAWHAAQKKKTK